jgi:hypothetical protein
VKKLTCIIFSKRSEIYLSLDKNLMPGTLLCFTVLNKHQMTVSMALLILGINYSMWLFVLNKMVIFRPCGNTKLNKFQLHTTVLLN